MRGHRVRRAAIGLAVLMTAAAPREEAHAGCDVDLARFQVSRGTLARGARCGSMVIATDASATRTSQARIMVPATVPYTLTLEARRLTGDGNASVQVEVQGGYLMWRDGAWGMYFDEAQFARDGWHSMAGLDSRRAHRIVVERMVGEVAITLDGVALGRWPLLESSGMGPSIGLAGRRGARARLLVRELAVSQGAAR